MSLYFLSFSKNNQKNQAPGIHSVQAQGHSSLQVPGEFPSAPCSPLRRRRRKTAPGSLGSYPCLLCEAALRTPSCHASGEFSLTSLRGEDPLPQALEWLWDRRGFVLVFVLCLSELWQVPTLLPRPDLPHPAQNILNSFLKAYILFCFVRFSIFISVQGAHMQVCCMVNCLSLGFCRQMILSPR